jgi:uncharacterized membrane protein (UPF0127 family)
MMTRYHLLHVPSSQRIAVVTRADTWLSKGWGVLGRRSLPPGEGLWLPGVASVHTLGVRFTLDLLFLNDNMQTLRAVQNVPPCRFLVRASGASHTLEFGAGTLSSLRLPVRIGDDWRLERE